MGKETAIEYCDSTVNPVLGCTGCELYHPDPARNRCYAAVLVRRYAGRKGWPASFTEPGYFVYRLERALNWPDLTGQDRPGKPWLNGYPRIIFVNDLSDGFCPEADPERWLTPFLDHMAASAHIWLILTKWPGRMAEYFQRHDVPENFWLGVTVVGNRDRRKIRQLTQGMPPSVRLWLSYEPALGALELSSSQLAPLDWVVAGGESGDNAHPSHPDCFRRVRDACVRNEVPFFFKEWGRFLPESQAVPGVHVGEDETPGPDDRFIKCKSKYATGRLLDGQQWSQMPRPNASRAG